MKFMVATVLFLMISLSLQAQDQVEQIMYMLGEHSEETLSAEIIEHYSWYIGHPIDLNRSGRKELEKSELFTGFQIASLIDYISRTGAILSFAELSVLEGFSPDIVERLRPFISLSSMMPAPEEKKRNLDGQLNAYSSFSQEFKAGGKVRMNIGKHLHLGGGIRQNGYSFTSAYEGDGILASAVVGCYNARFGQGLGLWSGFSMSGTSSLSSLVRKPSGIVPSYSYTADYAMTGAAVELSLPSGIGISGFADIGTASSSEETERWFERINIRPGFNLSWKPFWGEMSLTAYAAEDHYKVSGDFRTCIRGVDLFCETAVCLAEVNSVAFLAGSVFPLGDGVRGGLHMRYYPDDFVSGLSGAFRSSTKTSNEYGLTGYLEAYSGRTILDVSADILYNPSPPYLSDDPGMQIKAALQWKYKVSESFSVFSKAGFRLRSYGGNDYIARQNAKFTLREELTWDNSVWLARLRADCVIYRSFAYAAALESGYRKNLLAIYLKATLFCADDWDDRIYSYNRDAPGNFSSSALYGRGVSASAYMSLDLRFRKKETPGNIYLGKLYLKSVFTSYFRGMKPTGFQIKLEYIRKL